jgi:ribosomal protein L11 methyltransferase
MNNTIQVTIEVADQNLREELIARLSTLNFDAFEEKEQQLEAFIQENQFDENKLIKVLNDYKIDYKVNIIADQNWNALWESNFQPVVVDDFCAIRAHFHAPFTDISYEIVITPKMSFGTGHHATTYLMISEMRKLDFKNNSVADFGTGTGILAILADKLGSEKVWAIDYDDWSIENAKENVARNACNNIIIEQLDSFSGEIKFDIILANINKHVILENANGLFFGLNKEGKLLLSGLLKEDEADIVLVFTRKGLTHVSTVEKNNWICLLFQYDQK